MNKQPFLLYKELLGSINSAPLNQSMLLALRLARELENADFEKWLRLEIGGYLYGNPVYIPDVEIPDYRKVVGDHYDKYGQAFIVQQELQFINKIYLKNGIDELEKMASTTDMIDIQDPTAIEGLQKMFNVDAYFFKFHPLQITGILGHIKLRLSDWLYEIKRSYPELSSEQEKETGMTSQNHQPININFGNGASVGNLVVSRSITNSFNKLESAEISGDLKKALQDLANAVNLMTAAMSSEDAEQAARDLETLTAEVISKSPRQQWWQLSLEGLKKAAENVGEVGLSVLKIAASVIALLSVKP